MSRIRREPNRYWSKEDKFGIINEVVVLPVFFIASIGIFGYFYYDSKNYIKLEHTYEDTVDILLKEFNKNDIRLYVDFNNGGYTEFRGIKSYIDPRAEYFLKSINKKLIF